MHRLICRADDAEVKILNRGMIQPVREGAIPATGRRRVGSQLSPGVPFGVARQAAALAVLAPRSVRSRDADGCTFASVADGPDVQGDEPDLPTASDEKLVEQLDAAVARLRHLVTPSPATFSLAPPSLGLPNATEQVIDEPDDLVEHDRHRCQLWRSWTPGLRTRGADGPVHRAAALPAARWT